MAKKAVDLSCFLQQWLLVCLSMWQVGRPLYFGGEIKWIKSFTDKSHVLIIKVQQLQMFIILQQLVQLYISVSQWADLCKAFLVEAKWCSNKETPALKAYLENGVVSASGVLILVHAYFLLTETISPKEALECLEKEYHPLMECSSLIFRLSNDLGTSQVHSVNYQYTFIALGANVYY